MRETWFHKSRRWLLASAAATLGVVPALASPGVDSDELRARIGLLNAAVAMPENAAAPALTLIEQSGLRDVMALPPLAAPGFRSIMPVAAAPSSIEVQLLNMRLSLGMLSQSFGAKNNFAVLQAQRPGRTDALVISRGTATLADLQLFMQHYRLQAPSADGSFVASAPIIVLNGATLRLGEGEVLNLSREHGAFVINFGHLDINGATIAAVGPQNSGTPSFAPFVTTGLQGTAHVQRGHFVGLGFGQTLKFSGFSLLRNALLPVRDVSFIKDSIFENVRSVSIHAVNEIEISNNRFHDARGGPLVVTRTRGARIAGNLFTGDVPTNAIRLINGSIGATVTGNVILGGENAGISVTSGSDHPTIAHNIVWNRNGGGIRLVKSNCGRVFENIVMDNRQKGIEVRTSLGTEVSENLIAANNSAGIWVSAQEGQANTVLRANVLDANGAGLGTATAEEITMIGNDFSRQFPKFLSGDLARQNRHIASDMNGAKAVVLSADGVSEAAPPAPVCGVY